jgi:hypothetical protein
MPLAYGAIPLAHRIHALVTRALNFKADQVHTSGRSMNKRFRAFAVFARFEI